MLNITNNSVGRRFPEPPITKSWIRPSKVQPLTRPGIEPRTSWLAKILPTALTSHTHKYKGNQEGKYLPAVRTFCLFPGCGRDELITVWEGTLKSPNYPQTYPDNITCSWVIAVSPGNQIKITVYDIKVGKKEVLVSNHLAKTDTVKTRM